MGLAELRRQAIVGDWPDRPSAAQFRTEVYRTNAVVSAIAADIARNVSLLGMEERASWSGFMMRWGDFYDDYKDVGSLTNFFFDPDAYDQLFDLEREARSYRDLLSSRGGVLVAPTPPPSSQETDRGGGNSLIWGTLIVGGIFAGGYLIKAVRG